MANLREQQQLLAAFRSQHCREELMDFIYPDLAEKYIATLVSDLAKWRIPITPDDLFVIVHSYLDNKNVQDKVFKDNRPSRYWARSFAKRHKLKSARAAIDEEDVNKYFDNLEKELAGVPSDHVFNFDETIFSNDPKCKRVLVNSGMRRVETIVEYSKQSTSIMFCGDAAGNFLPPMVVYKAKHVYENWIKDGPEGALYSSSKKGWFETKTLGQWFKWVFLKHEKHLDGKKVMIDDYLGCHFSEEVLRLCRENDVAFVPLIPNSTHLTQPLDVTVFRPMKVVWFKVLEEWRKERRCKGNIPKDVFPSLLRKVCDRLAFKDGKDLQAGFRTCGIHPIERNEILRMLPGSSPKETAVNNVRVLTDVCIDLIKENYPKPSTSKRPKRGKNTVPGMNVVLDRDTEVTIDDDDEIDGHQLV